MSYPLICFADTENIGTFTGSYLGKDFSISCDEELCDKEFSSDFKLYIEERIESDVQTQIIAKDCFSGELVIGTNAYSINGKIFAEEENAKEYADDNEIDYEDIEDTDIEFRGWWG
jgi:hypothetical protein